MVATKTLQIAQRGVVTLPKSIRDGYGLREGDTITLFDLDGVLVLVPHRLEIGAIADKIAGELRQNGETLESMLRWLREQRESGGSETQGIP